MVVSRDKINLQPATKNYSTHCNILQTISSYNCMTLETFKIEVLPVKNKLYRFALRMLGNRDEAEDVVQDTLMRLWIKRTKLSSYRSIEAFAMIITKNLCLDMLRSRKRIMVDLVDEHTIDSNSPYKLTELTDTMNRVYEEIDKLPEQQKMIMFTTRYSLRMAVSSLPEA